MRGSTIKCGTYYSRIIIGASVVQSKGDESGVTWEVIKVMKLRLRVLLLRFHFIERIALCRGEERWGGVNVKTGRTGRRPLPWVWAREGGTLHQGSGKENGKKWTDSRVTSELTSTKFTDGLVGVGRKQGILDMCPRSESGNFCCVKLDKQLSYLTCRFLFQLIPQRQTNISK